MSSGKAARRAIAVLAVLSRTACATDPAEQEYLAALAGEETGMTRGEQIAHLDRAIALAPGRAHYRETRATYRFDLRQFGLASADLARAIEIQDRPYLRFLRGLVECERGAPGEALADFDLAIARQPENAQFYRGRALARVRVGRLPEALADGERLVALAPQMGESYHARGTALAALGRLELAIADFDEALRRRPELVYPLLARADCQQRLGNPAAAAADREEAARKSVERAGCAPCLDPFRY